MSPAGADGVYADAALLRGAVDKISAMLAYWDSAQRCRFANRAYERWFGVSPESLIGKHISELLGPIYPLNLPYIEGALRGEPQEFEREIPDPAGGPLRYSLANYIPDIVDGVVRGFFVLVSDVSAIKRAELALKDSEARFSGIISIAADAIISVDEDQVITIFNTGAEKIFGYAKAEVIGRDLGMLVPARLRETHRRRLTAFLASGGAPSRQMGERQATIFGIRKNGDEFPAEAAISKLEIGGKPILTVALRDITERKRTELEQMILAEAGTVLASSLNYRQTLKSIAQMIVRHVADLCVVDMIEDDARVERLTVAHADPAKAGACEVLGRLSLEPRYTLALSALETRQPQVFDDITSEFLESSARDEEHRRALRELAPRSAIVVPLLSSDSVLGALVFASSRPHSYGARDVGFATELGRRAALAIENARLYEAEQQATRARDEVLGVVAHDVRSPLNAIGLAADLLGRKLAKAGLEGDEQVKSILRSVSRANRLIEDLLDVTRIEAGVLGLERQAAAVEQILVDVMTSQQLAASAASIELRLEIDDEPPLIWADRHRVLQVLDNLVGNALKFTPNRGRITIGAVNRAGEVLFSVADTGHGIPEENLPHVFDRFWQAKKAERRGAGLGLPICKGIVEAHGGRIWAESVVGRGTTFFFTLPTTDEALARREPSALSA